MTYRRVGVPQEHLTATVVAEASAGEPLGAFSDGDVVEYLILGRDGMRSYYAHARSGDRLGCAGELPLFDWDEREMRGELFIENGRIPAALAAEGRGVTVVVVGPVHAGIIEPGRFTISSGGETVIHLDAQLSYSRRGVEGALRGMNALDAAKRVARICGGCSVSRSYAYALAIERLSGFECDEPTQLMRLVLAELERLYNHLFDLASACAGAGYGKGQLEGLHLKERTQRLCDGTFGHRLLFDAIVPGGVSLAARVGDFEELRMGLGALNEDVKRYGEHIFHTDSLVRRFEGAGAISAEMAKAFGAVGPTRRASGLEFDVRTYAPYGAYRQFATEVVVEPAGDVLARVRVKVNEALESLRLLDAALHVLEKLPLAHPPPLEAVSGRTAVAVEGPRGAETLALECLDGKIANAHVLSASYRNWPLVTRAMEGNIVPDFPLVNKSFNLCYACADR